MNQEEKRLYLIRYLISEQPRFRDMEIPEDSEAQKLLLRSLFNVRNPAPISEELLKVQDEYLKAENESRGITDIASLKSVSEDQKDIYLWQGDITTLKCDAIVNAANSGMTGCYVPCHKCIDNAIHTFSGIQLRYECAQLMEEQGYGEPTGRAKITKAYNLPCKHVIHTVGPIISGQLTKEGEELLGSCYNSCLELAEENGLESIAFSCISTGEFHFPPKRAAEIAVETVKEYKKNKGSNIKVIFNVFMDNDFRIYRELLGIN